MLMRLTISTTRGRVKKVCCSGENKRLMNEVFLAAVVGTKRTRTRSSSGQIKARSQC